MKVLDLRCTQEHAFEGWFASEDDFQSQCQRGLLQCPICSDTQVRKVLSAPRIQRGATQQAQAPAAHSGHPVPASEPGAESSDGLPAPMQAALLQWARRAAAESEDVGERFVQEARSIHRGESPERPIRGQASAVETLDLLQEGIAVLPLPPSTTGTLH